MARKTGREMSPPPPAMESMNPDKIYINCICGLSFLNGRSVFPKEVEVSTLFDF